MSLKQKIPNIDIINVIAVFAVIILHSNACFWSFSSTYSYWIRANIIESVFYFGVPIFLMLSGICLIDYNNRYSLKEYLLKRINKTLIPYIFWSLFGLIFHIFCINSISLSKLNLSNILTGLVTFKHVAIFWFFGPLFFIYLLIPLFSLINKDRKNIFKCIISGIFVLSLIPFLAGILNINLNIDKQIVSFLCFCIYPLIGYYLYNYEINKKTKYIIYFLGILFLLMHIVGTYVLSVAVDSIVMTFKGYTNIPSILYSSAVFLFLKNNIIHILKNSFLVKTFTFLRRYTFSIFLIHFFIFEFTFKMIEVNPYSVSFLIISPIVIIILSVLIIKILRKIPYFKIFLPE